MKIHFFLSGQFCLAAFGLVRDLCNSPVLSVIVWFSMSLDAATLNGLGVLTLGLSCVIKTKHHVNPPRRVPLKDPSGLVKNSNGRFSNTRAPKPPSLYMTVSKIPDPPNQTTNNLFGLMIHHNTCKKSLLCGLRAHRGLKWLHSSDAFQIPVGSSRLYSSAMRSSNLGAHVVSLGTGVMFMRTCVVSMVIMNDVGVIPACLSLLLWLLHVDVARILIRDLSSIVLWSYFMTMFLLCAAMTLRMTLVYSIHNIIYPLRRNCHVIVPINKGVKKTYCTNACIDNPL